MLGLGIALIAGVAVRPAAVAGVVLLAGCGAAEVKPGPSWAGVAVMQGVAQKHDPLGLPGRRVQHQPAQGLAGVVGR